MSYTRCPFSKAGHDFYVHSTMIDTLSGNTNIEPTRATVCCRKCGHVRVTPISPATRGADTKEEDVG